MTVEGRYYSGCLTGRNEREGETEDETSLYDGPFEVDLNLGIVKFPEHVFLVDQDDLGVDSHQRAADLYLLCSYNARDARHGLVYYKTKLGNELGAPTNSGSVSIYRPDLYQWRVRVYPKLSTKPSGTFDNTSFMSLHGEQMGISYLGRYKPVVSYDTHLVGIWPVNLNGVVRQARWKTGHARHSETTYCVSNELTTPAPTAIERRMAEEVERNIGEYL